MDCLRLMFGFGGPLVVHGIIVIAVGVIVAFGVGFVNGEVIVVGLVGGFILEVIVLFDNLLWEDLFCGCSCNLRITWY